MEVVIALLRNVACVAKSLLPEDHRLFRPFNHYPHSTNLDILIIVLQTGERSGVFASKYYLLLNILHSLP